MRTKALEWVKHPHANLWRADCLTGRYQVYAITSPITWGFDGFDGLTEVFGESPTEEAAKAAAQSHFDAAIASVLEDDWQTIETALDAIRATPEPVAPTPSQEPDRSRMYKVGDQWWPYPHGMTEEEWNRKIGTPSYEHAKDLPED